jgi:anaerobic selenocysteine-containing dehydrogenase
MRTERSFCRICANTCGVVVEIDDEDRIVSVRGDRAHAVTQGYACSKGVGSGAMHRREDRILRPLRREADGSLTPIDLERALDEIADRMAGLIERFGPHAIAGFLGTTGYFNVPGSSMFVSLLEALGSRSFFSSFTIDCSNKAVTAAASAAGARAGKNGQRPRCGCCSATTRSCPCPTRPACPPGTPPSR